MKYNKQLLTILFMFLLVLTLAQGEIITLEINGEQVVIDETLCKDEVRGTEELGNDFYLFCESNFEEEYNNQSLLEEIEAEPVEGLSFDLSDEKMQKLLKTLSVLLFVLLVLMIFIRHRSLRLHKMDSFLRLHPYLVQLKNRGYSEEEIHDMLLKRGYEEPFINELLRNK